MRDVSCTRAVAGRPTCETFPVKRSAAFLLTLLAACAVQRPQVLTPVRIDTTRAAAAGSPVEPSASPPFTGAGRPRSIETDPLARADRME